MPLSAGLKGETREPFSGGQKMGNRSLEPTLRRLAGAFVLISLALGHWHSPYWLLFTAFVGLNLFRCGLTQLWYATPGGGR